MSTLLADVGGTNVRFALADTDSDPPLRVDTIRRYRVADFAGFSDAARAYLRETNATPTHAVFAFAGPVAGDAVQLTNHPWTIVLSRARGELGLQDLRAINDFAAMSLAVSLLGESDIEAIGRPAAARVGSTAQQTFAIIGPGTGLGVGALLVRDGRFHTLESEGGHLGFAPRDELEIEILRRLVARFGRVSNERLLCGAGLVNLHAVLAEIDGAAAGSLAPNDITQRALDRSDTLCVRAVELFCALLGAAAGDLVLAFGAWDGVYLSGGLTPHLRPWLQAGAFRRRFEDKGRSPRALQRADAGGPARRSWTARQCGARRARCGRFAGCRGSAVMTRAEDDPRIVWESCADEAAWVQRSVDVIVAALQVAQAQAAPAKLLLSGGSTPVPVYRALAATPVDWSRVVVGLVDERDVEPITKAAMRVSCARRWPTARACGSGRCAGPDSRWHWRSRAQTPIRRLTHAERSSCSAWATTGIPRRCFLKRATSTRH